MNGITYFKLNSQYEGDFTKNCALTGSEVDGNFYTLEGRDIKSVFVKDGKVVVKLLNGEEMSTDSLTENCVKDLDISFDEVNGILTITQNGITQTITGFATNYNVGDAISVDGTLVGNGLAKSPVGISPIMKTGQYRPVKGFIRKTNGEKLPIGPYVFPGDRFLTEETVNGFGLLYNYEGVKKIACALREQHSEWRIPTKDDWDDMLDAVEPAEEYRNHTSATANKYLGHYAGKYLKSKNGWKHDEKCHGYDDNCIDYSEDCACGKKENTCHPSYCGEYGSCHHIHKHNDEGLGKYGFNVLPAGMADDGHNYSFFKERAYFWTATNSEYRNAYVKSFLYNKSSVLQDVLASGNHLSLRLVKDFKGDNYNEREDILGGEYSTVLMPSIKHGKSIWTSVNVSIMGCGCDCHYLIPNNNQGISDFDKIKYFINEWNGKEWIRKEVLDGESVVLVTDEKILGGKTVKCYSELRNENGVMKNVAKHIKGEVVDMFKHDIKGIKEDIRELDERLTNAIDDFKKADGEINGKVDDLYQKVNDNKQAIESEVNRSTEKDTELEARIVQNSADIKSLEEATSANFDRIDTKIDEEIERAKKAEQDLDTKADEIEKKFDEKTIEIDNKFSKKTAEIEGKLLTNEGSNFNAEDGVLTLKSNNGTNDIKIQFNMNFGEF